jgi:hypothetical protein
MNQAFLKFSIPFPEVQVPHEGRRGGAKQGWRARQGRVESTVLILILFLLRAFKL